MSDESAWEAAFRKAAAATDGTPADDAQVAWARRVVAARRDALENEACPPNVHARLKALFREHKPRTVSSVLRLVMDSWRDMAPATRGANAARMVRYEAGPVTIDMRLRRAADNGEHTIEFATDGLPANTQLWLQQPPTPTWHAVPLDDSGSGRMTLPANAEALMLGTGEQAGDVTPSAILRLDDATQPSSDSDSDDDA